MKKKGERRERKDGQKKKSIGIAEYIFILFRFVLRCHWTVWFGQ